MAMNLMQKGKTGKGERESGLGVGYPILNKLVRGLAEATLEQRPEGGKASQAGIGKRIPSTKW